MAISYETRPATIDVPSLVELFFGRFMITNYDDGASKVDRNNVPVLLDPLGEGQPGSTIRCLVKVPEQWQATGAWAQLRPPN